MSPKSFAEALVDALSDPSGVKATKIQSFVNLFNIKQNVVIGAYGNRNSDTKAYLDAGIPRDRIFLVNSNSVLRRVSDGKKTSYHNHVVKVNEMYYLKTCLWNNSPLKKKKRNRPRLLHQAAAIIDNAVQRSRTRFQTGHV